MFEVDIENSTEEELQEAKERGKRIGIIGTLDEEELKKARHEGKKIGLVQGSWDQFHIGHLRYLKKARENCDYLIVALDSDAKIQKRKGPNRPLIPEDERYAMLKELGFNKIKTYEPGRSLIDDIVIKPVNEKKWGLIKRVRPDVLIVITENYTTEEIDELTKYCDSVTVLPRQAETSTSNKLRQKLIANMSDKVEIFKELHDKAVEDTIARLGLKDMTEEPYPEMAKHLNDSTEWKVPVVAAALVNGKWYFGTNQPDVTISKKDLHERTELFYSTVEHAEINLLKRISDIGLTDTIYVTLFPCDRCMKTLIDKGIKKIYYFEDHKDRNWSKRSHELAEKKGITLINVREPEKTEVIEEPQEEVDYSQYKFSWLPNVRSQEQLDIMVALEDNNQDPIDPSFIDQEIIYIGSYWIVTNNRFKYAGAEDQFLLISKEPIYCLEDMSEAMQLELHRIWLNLIEVYHIQGGAMCFRFGDCALSGASQKRIHAHIIKPKENEKVEFKIGGKRQLKKGLVINHRPLLPSKDE